MKVGDLVRVLESVTGDHSGLVISLDPFPIGPPDVVEVLSMTDGRKYTWFSNQVEVIQKNEIRKNS